jgi:hypothetical protein
LREEPFWDANSMTTHSDAELRQFGLDAIRDGQYDRAAQAFIQAVGKAPGNGHNWLGLLLASAHRNDFAMAAQAIDLWASVRRDRFGCLFDAFTLLMSYGLHDQVLALVRALGADGPESLPGLYYCGCVHLLRDDEDEAFRHFNRFKELAEASAGSLPIASDNPFNIAYRQGTLIEDIPAAAAMMAAPPPELPALQPFWEPRASAAPLVLAAACDEAYLTLCAGDFLRSVERTNPGALVHLHVVEPGPGCARHLAGLAAAVPLITLNATWEPPPRHRSATYFACSRFLIAGQLLAVYGRDLLVSDIDMEVIADLAALHPRLAEWDFCCYTHSGWGPASRYPAVLTHFSPQGGARVADALARYIVRKLPVPWPHSWMLDQAALISVQRWLRHQYPDVRLGRLDAVLGQPFTGLLAQQQCAQEKHDAIMAAR